MSGKNNIESTPNLSDVMLKMRNTLVALSDAFDQAISMQDPIDQTQHEIEDAVNNRSKKQEIIES